MQAVYEDVKDLQVLKRNFPGDTLVEGLVKYTMDHDKFCSLINSVKNQSDIRYANLNEFENLKQTCQSKRDSEDMKSELKGQSAALKNRVNELTVSSKLYADQISTLMNLNDQAASSDEVIMIKNRLSSFTSLQKFNELKEELKFYQSVLDADEQTFQFKQEIDQMHKILDDK